MIETLFVCDTPYQIIVACCIQKQKQEEAAIILTDHTLNMREIYNRMGKYTTLFQSVLFVEAKKYSMESNKYTNQDIDCEILNLIESNSFMRCNHLLIGTLEPYMQRLFKVFKHDIGQKRIRGGIIEDGFSTYSYYGDVIKSYKYTNDLKEIYIFTPSIMAWEPDRPVIEIDKSCFKEDAYIEELNKIFGFYEMEDRYKEKFIVLASGYSEIAQLNNLHNILNDLEEIAGKEEILIKKHPRITDNLYEKYGYKTNINTVVPWEIIALNCDLSNKVIISSYSGCLYTPKLLFDKKMIGITVINFVNQEDPLRLMDYYTKYILKICGTGYFAPRNRDEYKKLLEKCNSNNMNKGFAII